VVGIERVPQVLLVGGAVLLAIDDDRPHVDQLTVSSD
jgi:hypothetical protein